MTCGRCDHGWVTVGDAYAAWRWPDPPEWPGDPEIAAAVAADLARKRRWAAHDIYPCKACKPDLHERWSKGHLASGHTCGECTDLRRGRRARRTRRELPELPERKDLL